MKKLLFLLLLASLPTVTFAQSVQKTADEKKLTKFEEFSSKTGTIMKFEDVNLPNIKDSFLGSLQNGIRIFFGSQENSYFYRIEEPETSRSISHIAMIEYSDLVEINKALVRITADVEGDLQKNPDYLENKFVTDDGFEVGYYLSKGKVNWFLKLERYSSSTVFIKDQATVIDAFKGAQFKIEELKNKYGK